MDITKFVVSGRDQAFLYGDHATYRKQLGKKLLNCRKKLNIATKSRGKFKKRDPVTADEVAQSHDYVQLQLLTSERAWAHAMSMKSAHSADANGITGKSRSHIASRLDKAAKAAEHLVAILSDPEAGAGSTDVLEARAYAAMVRGTERFEKQAWEPCIRSLAVAYIIYGALATTSRGDVYADLNAETIDPSIRYAAYRLKTPRTVPVPVIARKAFPADDAPLVEAVKKLDPNALRQGGEAKKGLAEGAPQSFTWRSREVRIEDAATAQAWAAVQAAKEALPARISAIGADDLKAAAGAYDDILAASQEAVDATKQAIDELKGEGVPAGDSRMQSLQITWTAVNYETTSWRVGRNRVLTGVRDGAVDGPPVLSRRRAKRAFKEGDKDLAELRNKEDKPSRRLARLKEKVALYDGTLQNLESVKALPGVPADEELSAQLEATTQYFFALKCLSVARSHAIVGKEVNALALIKHAVDAYGPARKLLSQSTSTSNPPSIAVAADDAKFLANLLAGELQRHRALVHLENLERTAAEERASQPNSQPPLIDRLHDYPPGGADLHNLVRIPPQLAPIPVKPIFLDVAWNYIEYPRDEAEQPAKGKGKEAAAPAKEEKSEQPQQQKRGWFGFGR